MQLDVHWPKAFTEASVQLHQGDSFDVVTADYACLPLVASSCNDSSSTDRDRCSWDCNYRVLIAFVLQ